MDDDLKKLSGRVIGAAIEVHRVLGPGYLEKVPRFLCALCVSVVQKRFPLSY